MRYLLKHSRHLHAQQLQFTCTELAERFQDTRNHVTQEGHHCKMVLDKAELNIQADIFVDVACRVMRLGAEDRANLEDALEDSHHDLLIELGTLCQVSISPKVVQFEDISPALGSRGDDLWRLYLGEIARAKD